MKVKMLAQWRTNGESLASRMKRAVLECQTILRPELDTINFETNGGTKKRPAPEAEPRKEQRREEPEPEEPVSPVVGQLLEETQLLWLPTQQAMAIFEELSFERIEKFCSANPILRYRFLGGAEPTDARELFLIRYKKLAQTSQLYEMLLARDYGITSDAEKCHTPILPLREMIV